MQFTNEKAIINHIIEIVSNQKIPEPQSRDF